MFRLMNKPENLRLVGLSRILAITAPDNQSSIKLLEQVGFPFEKMASVFAEEPDARSFAWERQMHRR